MFIQALLAFSLLGHGLSAVAEPQSLSAYQQRTKENRLRQDLHYATTLAMCRGEWGPYGHIFLDTAKEIVSLGFLDSQAISRFRKNQYLAPEVAMLLESEAFYLALRDCGRGSEKIISGQIKSIMAADFAGRVAGFVTVYALYRSGFALAARMATWGVWGKRLRAAFVVGLLAAVTVKAEEAYSLTEGKAGAEFQQQASQWKNESAGNQHALNDFASEYFRQQLSALEQRLRSESLSENERQSLEAKTKRLKEVLKSY